MKYKHIFLGEADYYKYIFESKDENKDYLYFDNDYICSNIVKKFIYLLLKKANSYLHIRAVDFFCYNFCMDFKNICDDVVIVIVQFYMYSHDNDFIQYLRRRYKKAKILLFLTNSVSMIYENVDELKKIYDGVISVSRHDSIVYDLHFHNLPYKNNCDNLVSTYDYDVVFCGRDKNRRTVIEKIFYQLINKGLKCKIIMLIDENDNREKIEGIDYIYNKIQYIEYIYYVKKSRSILEIVTGANDEDYSSLRYLEAIAFKRKLISNNRLWQKEDYTNQFSYIDINNLQDYDYDWIKVNDEKGWMDGTSLQPRLFFEDIEKI